MKPLVPPRAWQFFAAHVVPEGLSRVAEITPVDPLQRQLEASDARRVWVDVGAHRGEITLPWAKRYRHLTVYAFEPNVPLAARLAEASPNFVVIAAAVADQNAVAPLFLTRDSNGASLLPMDPAARAAWIGGEDLEVVGRCVVPTVRIDTFLDRMRIEHVDFLKVDAQGSDLAVVASAGSRLKDIDTVVLEVATTASPVYRGSADRESSIAYMRQHGFELIHVTSQTHDQEQNLTFRQRTYRK